MTMPAYSPCPACQRHVRGHERVCPFCSVALSPACAPGTPCQAIPRGAKRATLIALSLGAVAACSSMDDDTAVVPVYGAPAAPVAGAGGTASNAGGTSSGGTNAGGTDFGGSSAGGTDNGGTSGAAGDDGSGDAGPDADAASDAS
jgi:hypothetical protein